MFLPYSQVVNFRLECSEGSFSACQNTLPIPHTVTQMLPLWSYPSEVFLASVFLGYLSFTSLITFHDVYHYLSTCAFAFLSDTLIGLWGLCLIDFFIHQWHTTQEIIFSHKMKQNQTLWVQYPYAHILKQKYWFKSEGALAAWQKYLKVMSHWLMASQYP